jgi:hypothetical protein
LLTASELKTVLHYDPETGEFIWLVTNGRKRREAGSIDPDGYRRITVNGRAYQASRLAWLYMTGDWPRETVDHKNRIPLDNRWENLREATRQEQTFNRKVRSESASGFKGVRAHGKKFRADIKVGGRSVYVGTFDTPEAAFAARNARAQEHHGQFAA